MINYFPNIIKCRDKIMKDFNEFQSGSLRYLNSVRIGNAIGKTQSGKSQLQQAVAEAMGKQFIFACTTYSNTELVEQHKGDFKIFPNVVTFKIATIMSDKSPQYYEDLKVDIKESMNFGNTLFLMFDESEYRVGEQSILNKFIDRLANDFPQLRIYILFVGATPMSLRALESKLNVPLQNFLLEPGDGYVGLEELLEMGCVFDTSHIKPNQEKLKPHTDILNILDDKIQEFDKGLFMMRVSSRTTIQAENWKDHFSKIYGDKISNGSLAIITAHTDNLQSIRDTISKAERKCQYQRVILIVVGSLQAGYRLFSNESLKNHIHFAYEPSQINMTACQGLTARTTGYYKPLGTGPAICMREDAIHEYSTLFDLDKQVIPSPKASTHTRGAATFKRKFTPCKVIGEFPIPKGLTSGPDIIKYLGYDKSNTRFSTSDFWNFDGQWKNSKEENPNYNVISYTYKGVKDFTILINKKEKIARVVQKTGQESFIQESYHNSVETNTSMFANSPYSDFNKENK